MFCFKCGKELMEGAMFCAFCGTNVQSLYKENTSVGCAEIINGNQQKSSEIDAVVEKNVIKPGMSDAEAEALADLIAGVDEKKDDRESLSNADSESEDEDENENDPFLAAVARYDETNEMFPIFDHSLHIDRSLLRYSREYHAFEAVVKIKEIEIAKKCVDVNNFDALFERQFDYVAHALDEVKTYIFEEMLLGEGVDNVSSTELTDKASESFVIRFSNIKKAWQTVALYEEELGIESQCRTRWVGGGFGITGAIKGAVKAKVMNVGTDIATGIFKSITGTTDADKIGKLKKKLFDELKNDKKDEMLEAFHHISMDLFDFVYSKLIENGYRGRVAFNREGANTKYSNTMYMFTRDKKSFDETFYSICECIEMNPLEQKYYEALYYMAPISAVKEVLLSVYADDDGSWMLARALSRIDTEIRIDKIKEFTQDERVLNNAGAAVFSQDELNTLLCGDDPYEGDIYLFEDEFKIPVDKRGVSYYGYGNARIVIDSKRVVSFKRLNIKFNNLEFDEKYTKLVEITGEFCTTMKNYPKWDFETVVKKLVPLADIGEPNSCAILCNLYEDGYITASVNYEKYKEQQQYAGIGLDTLATCYLLGIWGIQENVEKAKDIYLMYSKMDYIDISQQSRGLYCVGMCMEKLSKRKLAKKYYMKAYELGNYNALYSLAKLEDPLDIKKVKEAAEHGIPEAAYDMGKRCMEADDWEDVQPDFDAAFKYFSDAGDYPPALYELGLMYAEGHGCHKNSRMAVNLFRQAASLGNVPALVELGISYANGEGVQQDYKSAVKYYHEAESKGSADAMYNLGICYFYGAGTEKDVERAHELFTKADKLGNEDAKQALDKLF